MRLKDKIWEKILIIYIGDKGLVFKINKGL